MEKIKLLVVDDSILFREVLARYLREDDMIEIVGKAGDAYSARDLIVNNEPDVMTLDLEMPRMDGEAFLKRLLPQYYIPTIIVSSCDDRATTCKEAGAVEFLKKPTARTNSDMAEFALELCKAIRRAYKSKHPESRIDVNKVPISVPDSGAKPAATAAPKAAPASSKIQNVARLAADAEKLVSEKKSQIIPPKRDEPKEPQSAPSLAAIKRRVKKSDAIIALGASTGGTEALERVVRLFPADTPPVIIVQHMPAGFTKLYSERLDRSCKMHVKEAEDGDRLEKGLIIVGAGENHLRLCKDARGWFVSSKPGEKVSGHCPSVDVMFNSVADVAGPLAIGAILTGMGRDGADGLLRMRQAGAFTIGQDKDTCVVYGMPMEAYNCGAVEVQAPLFKIAEIILSALY